MTLSVDIRPEVQAELARNAAVHRRAIESYDASLLEEAVDGSCHDAVGLSIRNVRKSAGAHRRIAKGRYTRRLDNKGVDRGKRVLEPTITKTTSLSPRRIHIGAQHGIHSGQMPLPLLPGQVRTSGSILK